MSTRQKRFVLGLNKKSSIEPADPDRSYTVLKSFEQNGYLS